MSDTLAKLTIWKTPFIKNISENGGAMNEAIKVSNPQTDIVIHSDTQKNGRAWGYTQPLKLLELIKNNKGIYEVITKFPHKLYFDIDKTGDVKDSFLNDIKDIINKYFPNAEIAVSGSIKPEKVSYHIIVNNYTIHNQEEREYVKQIVKHISENVESSFDWKVYTKNRNMKCINQSKRDGRVQEIIENQDYRKHLITCFINDYCLPFPKINDEIQQTIMIAKSKGLFDIGTLPKLNLVEPNDFDFFTCEPIQLLSMFPISKDFDHNYTHLIGRYCYYNNIGLEYFLSWISKKHNPLTEEIKQKWVKHFLVMDKFPKPSESKIIAVLSYYYPNMKKDKSYKAFANTFLLPEENIKYIDTITQDNFISSEKYSLFNVGMGGGKTFQTIEYLKNVNNGFIWLCPNKALANNTLNRLQEKEIDISYYLDFNANQKKNGILNDQQNLIIVLNSLHYLKDKKYGVIVIDEIETLIDKFLGDFMKMKKQIWDAFKYIILNAEKVIFLDAFITSKTLNFIKNLEGECISPVIYQRINEPSTRTVEIMKGEQIMINDIINNIKNDKKCFIFYPYKNASKNGNIISMEGLSILIEKETGKSGVYYNADVDDKIKGGLKDVNKSWKTFDFIITNNIITCGVNYERKDFDFAYIFIASHNSPRDIIQVSYRARFLSSENIKICYMGVMNQPNTFQIDTYEIGCPIYDKLIKSILVEKHSPLKKTLQLFCNKAHYKFVINEKVLSADLKKYISDLVSKCEVGFSYDSVEDIDFRYAELIQQNIFSQTATMIQKIMLQKYFFQLTFKESAEQIKIDNDYENKDISIIEHAWNENLSFFFSKNCELLSNPNNIFQKIKDFNNNDGIFPADITKVKLNESIINDIFTQFTFKYVTEKSSRAKILKEIFNTFFMKQIIKSKYTTESQKNVEYKIDSDYYNYLYDFCSNYMKYEIYIPELDNQDEYTVEM